MRKRFFSSKRTKAFSGGPFGPRRKPSYLTRWPKSGTRHRVVAALGGVVSAASRTRARLQLVVGLAGCCAVRVRCGANVQSGSKLGRDGREPVANPARFRQDSSGFLLGLQNLPTLVHAGFQIEVMRTAQFAGILVLGISRLLQCIRRAAHATPRGRCFSSWNGHVGVL